MLTKSSSTIIEYIRENDLRNSRSTLAFYYFDFNDQGKQKPSNFLSSIAAQFCSQLPILPDRAKSLYTKCHEGRQKPVLKDLQATLGWIFKELDQVFIIIDAIDECPEKNEEREELLEIIKSMHDWSLDNLHMLATSRRELDIEAVLNPLLSAPPISIQSAHIDADIRLHVQGELDAISKRKKWPKDLTTEIEETFVSSANGM